jgi:hypothetical protein
MSTPAPIISDSPSYQKPESGKGRRQPRPEAGLVVATRAVRVDIAGIRHDSVLFSIDCRGQETG